MAVNAGVLWISRSSKVRQKPALTQSRQAFGIVYARKMHELLLEKIAPLPIK
jgi:hypothetical protein